MAKPGKMKKKCEEYRKSGRREINKAKKQERAQKRLNRFKERKENGKSYVYDKARATAKLASVYNLNSVEFKDNEDIIRKNMFVPNQNSGRGKHTDEAKNTGIFRKLNDFVKKQREEEKKKREETKKKGK